MGEFDAISWWLMNNGAISYGSIIKFLDLRGFYEKGILSYSLWALSTGLFTLIGLLISVAYFTLAERKIMAAMQRRRGPNIVGFFGLLQPLADGLKLLSKELIVPSRANSFVFFFSPLLAFVLAFGNWAFIPFSATHVFVDSNFGALLVFAISSFGVYGIVLAGWSSNSKYSFLGGLRSSAQMISYEVPMSIIVVTVATIAGSYNFIQIVDGQQKLWYFIGLFPLALIFFISGLAETNRAPFDLPEGESEIASGYNLEYSGILFALFFLAEYANMLLISALSSIYFLGGWHSLFLDFNSEFIFCIKIVLVSFVFVWVRATLPRYRYDQLMSLGWKVFIPVCISFLILIATIMYAFGSPYMAVLWL